MRPAAFSRSTGGSGYFHLDNCSSQYEFGVEKDRRYGEGTVVEAVVVSSSGRKGGRKECGRAVGEVSLVIEDQSRHRHRACRGMCSRVLEDWDWDWGLGPGTGRGGPEPTETRQGQ